MPVRIGILSTAHMHAFGYAAGIIASPDAELAGVWDDDRERGEKFGGYFQATLFPEVNELLSQCDAAVITTENARHAEMARLAAKSGKHILCEKPLATNEEDGLAMIEAARVGGVRLMTAFPCRFSPAYQRLKARVQAGDIGKVLSICATNHGSCPFGWFVEKDKSGGGAMMDHTVHVADLLRDLLQEEPKDIYAQTSNNIYGQEWEDTAMMHVTFPSGIFASIDASWSRPKSYKTWGDLRMNVVGDKGVIELDMFAQAFDVYTDRHTLGSFGSDLDSALIASFTGCVLENKEPEISGEDGLKAARFAFAGYRSASQNAPATVVK